MKQALITYGGWDGHSPKEGSELFARLLTDKGFTVTLRDDLDVLAQGDPLQIYDLIVVNWTMSQITSDQMKGLSDAITAGAGLAGFHGGLGDAFRNDTWFQFMVGGQFVAHPGNKINYTVEIKKTDHPITQGLSSFEMKDTEQYYMHVDPAVEVLATTTFSGEHSPETKGVVMPVAWTKPWGKGRVSYCSLGHEPKDFHVPEAQELILRSMLWAAR